MQGYYKLQNDLKVNILEGMVIIVRRFMSLALLVSLLVFSSAAAFAEPASKESWPDQLKFSAGPPGGNWFALGSTLADMWSKNTIPVTSSSGGGVSNIINCDRGRGDFGFSNTSILGAAVKGEQDFEGRATKNATILANLYTQYTYFVMNKNFAEKNGIKTFGDILEKKIPTRIATLKPGTGSEFVFKSLLTKGYNTNYDALKKMGCSIEFASYEGGADLMADGHLDLFVFSVGKIASIVMNIESNTDIVILEVDQPALDALAAAYGTVTFTIEPGIYKSVTKPVKTVGDYTCIVVRDNIPDTLAYELCKSMWEHKESLAKAVIDIDELTPEIAVPEGVPTQAGAKKFWEELRAQSK